jgi:AcrR family transcriptional regulator
MSRATRRPAAANLVGPARLPALRPGPAGGLRDANRRARAEQLADSALALFLEQGVAGVTIDQIVERAGVAKGSFYRYFSDKEQLVGALLAPLAAGIRDAFAACRAALAAARGRRAVSQAYLELARQVGRLIAAHPRAALFYLQEARVPAAGSRAPVRQLADEVANLAERLSTHARDHGLLRDLDPRLQALVVLGAVERLLFELLSAARPGTSARPARPLGPPDTLSEMLVSMILDGVRRRSR